MKTAPIGPDNYDAIAAAIRETRAWLLLLGGVDDAGPAGQRAADDLFYAAQCLEQARREAVEQPGGGKAPELLLEAIARCTRAETALLDYLAARRNQEEPDHAAQAPRPRVH